MFFTGRVEKFKSTIQSIRNQDTRAYESTPPFSTVPNTQIQNGHIWVPGGSKTNPFGYYAPMITNPALSSPLREKNIISGPRNIEAEGIIPGGISIKGIVITLIFGIIIVMIIKKVF